MRKTIFSRTMHVQKPVVATIYNVHLVHGKKEPRTMFYVLYIHIFESHEMCTILKRHAFNAHLFYETLRTRT